MNKKLILVLAMALVLVGGAFSSSRAQGVNGPYFTVPTCWSFACGIATPHVTDNAPNQVAPTPVGAVGY